MLNNTGITSESYGNVNQILIDPTNFFAMSVVVDSGVATVTENGRKIAKAGLPLAGSLDARTTAFTEAASTGTDVVGVLLHDVDVTDGDNNGTILLFGFVNTNRIESTTKAKLVAAVTKALPMIKFIAC